MAAILAGKFEGVNPWRAYLCAKVFSIPKLMNAAQKNTVAVDFRGARSTYK
jgi:hypothetical protein